MATTKQYCVGCKAVRPMEARKRVQMRNGRWVYQGTCLVCKNTMIKLGHMAKGDGK